jgi:HEAT repeat protein
MPLFAQTLQRYREQHEGRLPFLADSPPADLSDVLARLGQLKPGEFETAICFVTDLKRHDSVPALLDLMQQMEPGCAHDLAHAIATVGGKYASVGLQKILAQSIVPEVRQAAVYGLTWLMDLDSLPCLLAVFTNPVEPVAIRIQAIEGMNYLVSSAKACPFRQAASQAFLIALEDEDADIRAWSAYALGAMGEESATGRLREIAETDTATSPALGRRVCDEAGEALAVIAGC